MSKAEGKKIGIKFNNSLNNLNLVEQYMPSGNYTRPLGTITHSSVYVWASSNNGAKAFDGNVSTYWQTDKSGIQWVRIQLTTPKSISGYRFNSSTLNNVQLFGSVDGISYTLIHDSTNPNTLQWNTYTFNPTEVYEYYEIRVISRYDSMIYLYEVEFMYSELRLASGNEFAFNITGQEYSYTDGPNDNGVLITKNYPILLVQTHPSEPNAILLDVTTFRNAQGDITISYNQALGNLAGAGGAVASFEVMLNPIDLVEGLAYSTAYGTHEHISASTGGSIDFIKIEKIPTDFTEYISASVSGVIELKHISEINP